MVLYHAISTYQILEVALHRMKFHKKDLAILILPDFIKEKHKEYFNLVQLGIFNEVYLFPYSHIPHDENYIWYNIESIYKRNIPYNIEEFDTIYVAGLHFFFSILLIKKRRTFIAFEDAAGMVGKGDIIYNELKDKFPIHAQIAKDNGLFDFSNRLVKKVIVQHRSLSIKKHQNIFCVEQEMQKICFEDLHKIVKFFNVEAFHEDVSNMDLLLTERYSIIGKMTDEEQICLYKFLINSYFCERELIIKPHPDEVIPYKEIFPEALVLPGNFPSELISKIFENGPRSVCAFDSTALDALGKKYNIKRFNINEIEEEQNESNRRNSS